MDIGIPAELKNHERRVAATPEGVHALAALGHSVHVQSGAGVGAGFSDEHFLAAGAEIVADADEVWQRGDLILKVKEPIAEEYPRLRADQVLFTYLHLAASRSCTEALLRAGTTSIAYETVQLPDGRLPLLAPMSEVAGRLSIVAGSYHLMSPEGGRGTLLAAVAGTRKPKVVVIGGGVAGEAAARSALGLGARVVVIDVALGRLRALQASLGDAVETRASTPLEIANQISDADLVIGSVLVPGAAAPKLVTDQMVSTMQSGSVLVDIAIDQGGCFEGSRPTTHDAPTFAVHDSLYYCVANMPGAVPETSTRALTTATMPYARMLAELGWRAAVQRDQALAAGLSTHRGELLSQTVGEALGLPVGAPVYTVDGSA